jgi:hypothetical protein
MGFHPREFDIMAYLPLPIATHGIAKILATVFCSRDFENTHGTDIP